MKMGILGFPKVGKTTLFNLLTSSQVVTTKYTSGLVEPNVGIINVPDQRLEKLTELFQPKRTIPAQIEYVDIMGAAGGELRKSAYLASLRLSDALTHMVRAYEDKEIIHSEGEIEPQRDVARMDAELILADLMVLEGRLESLEQTMKKVKSKEDEQEHALLLRCKEALEKEKPLREVEFSPEEEKMLRGFGFLSEKPLLIVVNLGEEDLAHYDDYLEHFGLQEWAGKRRVALCPASGKLEMELSQLEDEERGEFMKEMGVKELSTERIIRTSYRLLELVSFFTYAGEEVKAWTIKQGTSALKAAGQIHTDIERGFIRAEVIPYDELIALGSLSEARQKGLLRLEGKTYQVQDGDVIYFRFSI
ncbi:MAG: redox-regulated ATPase YchF [Acidobacteriota bacterium]